MKDKSFSSTVFFKCAKSRLVGRPFFKKITIILFYSFFKPRMKIERNGCGALYWRSLSKRNDQIFYDDFYLDSLESHYEKCMVVDVKYSFDYKFIINICIFLRFLPFFRTDESVVGCLSAIFENKRYSNDEFELIRGFKKSYIMNESNFEIQLFIQQAKFEHRLNIEFICFQHAAYPKYNTKVFNESQVVYFLSSCDSYFLWDDFTKEQYGLAGRKNLNVLGRPVSNRFEKHIISRGFDNKLKMRFLFFLSGTHALEENEEILSKIKNNSSLDLFYFALHPNDDGTIYSERINIDRNPRLNDYDVILSVSSTVVVELIVAEAKLIVINGERYTEYGDFLNVSSVDDAIELIKSGCEVPKANASLNKNVTRWKGL